MFAGLAAVSCGGGGGNDPVPVDVPLGLTVQCERAFDGGTIPDDGTWLDAPVAGRTCLLYQLHTEADARYSVQVLIAAGGNVDVMVASTGAFLDLVAASTSFGDDAEASSFESGSGGTYHIALIGRADASTASTRAVRNLAAPTGTTDCASTIDGGELLVDGTGIDDLVFPRTCVLYRFAGTASSVYRLALAFKSTTSALAVALARDRDFEDRVQTYSDPEAPITLHLGADATQDYYVLVIGERFDLATYQISIERGNAPFGLVDRCFTAVERGAAPAGWTEVRAALAPRECHLYTMSVTADDIHFLSLRRLDIGVSFELRLATDAAFQDLVTTVWDTIEGQPVRSFTSATTRTIHVAVLNQFNAPLEYELRALSSAPAPSALDYFCNRSTPGGALTVDGGTITTTAMKEECVRFTLAVMAGVTYTLTAEPQPGSVALFVAEDPDHAQSLGSSAIIGPQGLSFTAPATATVYVTVAGRIDNTSFAVEAVTTLTPPPSLSGRCSFAVDSGSLAVGGGTVAGFVPTDHCDIYTFQGIAGTSYTVTVSGVDFSNPYMTLASDAGFSSIISEQTGFGGNALVFEASANQALYLAVHGFQALRYLVTVEVSPPPPIGMAADCISAKDGGALALGDAYTSDSAVVDQCVIYSFSGTSGTDYTITVYGLGGDPSLRVASDASFTDILTTQATPGGETYSFTAAATQDFFLAVFPGTAARTNFQIFVTSP